jgi:hypothetical protein
MKALIAVVTLALSGCVGYLPSGDYLPSTGFDPLAYQQELARDQAYQQQEWQRDWNDQMRDQQQWMNQQMDNAADVLDWCCR